MAGKIDLERKKGILEGAVKEALKKVKNVINENGYSISFVGEEVGTGRYQYANCIFYYRIIFEKPIKGKNGDIIGEISITPYRITKEDVVKAECGNDADIDFNARVEKRGKKNKEYVDYDNNSGNFHKKPDDNGIFKYQVVLLAKNKEGKYPGPGWGNPELYDKEDEVFKFPKGYVKTDYYFPNIGGTDEDTDYSIEDLLRQALDYLGISKKVKHE